MIDIILPFKSSRWQDLEVKYCLRSLEKHLTHYNRIYIIGDKPRSVPHVNHVPFENDLRREYKERNIYRKLLWAAENKVVSDPFLFVNDDHFLLADYDARCFPDYYGRWPQRKANDVYAATIANTRMIREQAAFYDIHCPMLMYKEQFLKNVATVDWEKKNGYCLKTLYAHGGQYYEDLKIYYQYPVNDLKRMIEGRMWFSIDDGARGPDMLQLLNELYPLKSKFEI